MAARSSLLQRLRSHMHSSSFFQGFTVRLWCSATSSSEEPRGCEANLEGDDDPKLKEQEELIVKDIQPILMLTRKILHTPRYLNGERLTMADERAVVEKLLVHHPHSEDKIGCGLESVMVDRHPLYQYSRCLFVVRTDGSWIDFSYKICLQGYIRDKYQGDAESFINTKFVKKGFIRNLYKRWDI